MAQPVKDLLAMQKTQETWVRSLEEEMTTHSSIFAWKSAWTEKPDGLQSRLSQSLIRLSAHTVLNERMSTNHVASPHHLVSTW